MLGAGRTELVRAIFGADAFDCGEIMLNGERVQRPNPRMMKNKGVGLIPENRKEEGLVQGLSTRENLCLTSLDRIAVHHIVSKTKEMALVNKQVTDLQILVQNLENPVSALSGGNQQKVVVGNWLNSEPQVMFFDEPSRGIDVNAKQQIFQIIWDLNRKGIASILISSELEELLKVCQRIIVMRHGRFEGELYPDDMLVDELYARCMEV
jgi:ribose transport system ATP-binding protein